MPRAGAYVCCLTPTVVARIEELLDGLADPALPLNTRHYLVASIKRLLYSADARKAVK